MNGIVVITGAFSYTGRYATRILLERGYDVRTLTNHPPGQAGQENPRPSTGSGQAISQNRRDPSTTLRASVGHPMGNSDPFGGRVPAFPYNFERPEELRRSLESASTLINTYWVRFPHRGLTFEKAVKNTRTLIQAARKAGIQRIVQVSIANPSLDSSLGYYRGKAQVEEAVRGSGLAYTILRPTVIFGNEDILINNIAWFVRKFPVFAIPGDGQYGVRPIYVEDMAELLAGAVQRQENEVIDAVGPETFSFEELVRLIADSVGRRVQLLHVLAAVAHVGTWLTGLAVKDVVLTWEEYRGLMDNLLASNAPAAGKTRLSEWLAKNAESVGRKYASEVARHFR